MGGNREETVPNRETARRQPTRTSRRLQEQQEPDEQEDSRGDEVDALRKDFRGSFQSIFSSIRSRARRADPIPTPSPVPSPAPRKKKKPRFKLGSYPVRHNERTYEARNEAAELEDGEVDYDDCTDVDEARQRKPPRKEPSPRWAPYVPYVHQPMEISHVEEPEIEDPGSHVAEALHFMDLDQEGFGCSHDPSV
jgi:hypothetical protein